MFHIGVDPISYRYQRPSLPHVGIHTKFRGSRATRDILATILARMSARMSVSWNVVLSNCMCRRNVRHCRRNVLSAKRPYSSANGPQNQLVTIAKSVGRP